MSADPVFERQGVPADTPFVLQDGELHVGGVALSAIADVADTPTYVYGGAEIDRAYERVAGAMAGITDRDVLVAYAIKANGNLALLARLARLGCGADIVSGGELLRATKAGIDPAKIVFSGVGKRAEEIRAALKAEIRAIHVESPTELELVIEEAKRRGVAAPIALRVNPNVDAETHPYIATGLHSTKFGLELDVATELLGGIVQSPHLRLEGVACHIGSQLGSVDPLEEAVAILGRFAHECRKAGAPLTSLDVGGGWPMSYGHEEAPYPASAEFAAAIARGIQAADAADFDLITEPGRALVGTAGALLTRVVNVKQQGDKRFVIVDAAMTELLRPALYHAYHAIVPVRASDAPRTPADVVGPVCESGDFFARSRNLPSDVAPGDLLAILGAGAYGREMSMTYNARPPAAEVLVDQGEWRTVRRRATVESLWALEEIG
ncbi:MAG: diaminopimelate decarboxylase [Myxococcota bacterium]